MRKLTTALAVSALFIAPSLTFAASIQAASSQSSVQVGQTFTVVLTATPSGSPIYTVSANLKFDQNIVQVSGFALAPTWIAVTQNGYDLTDNTNGSLIKTGGYPAGFNTPMQFGTVTFRAVRAGQTAITVTGDSVLLDSGSNNELSGSQGAAVINVVSAPAPTTTQNTTVTASNTTGTNNTGNTTNATASTTNNAGQAAAAVLAASGTSQTAAAANALGNVPQWIWWLLLAIIVIGGGYWLWRNYMSTN